MNPPNLSAYTRFWVDGVKGRNLSTFDNNVCTSITNFKKKPVEWWINVNTLMKDKETNREAIWAAYYALLNHDKSAFSKFMSIVQKSKNVPAQVLQEARDTETARIQSITETRYNQLTHPNRRSEAAAMAEAVTKAVDDRNKALYETAQKDVAIKQVYKDLEKTIGEKHASEMLNVTQATATAQAEARAVAAEARAVAAEARAVAADARAVAAEARAVQALAHDATGNEPAAVAVRKAKEDEIVANDRAVAAVEAADARAAAAVEAAAAADARAAAADARAVAAEARAVAVQAAQAEVALARDATGNESAAVAAAVAAGVAAGVSAAQLKANDAVAKADKAAQAAVEKANKDEIEATNRVAAAEAATMAAEAKAAVFEAATMAAEAKAAVFEAATRAAEAEAAAAKAETAAAKAETAAAKAEAVAADAQAQAAINAAAQAEAAAAAQAQAGVDAAAQAQAGVDEAAAATAQAATAEAAEAAEADDLPSDESSDDESRGGVVESKSSEHKAVQIGTAQAVVDEAAAVNLVFENATQLYHKLEKTKNIPENLLTFITTVRKNIKSVQNVNVIKTVDLMNIALKTAVNAIEQYNGNSQFDPSQLLHQAFNEAFIALQSAISLYEKYVMKITLEDNQEIHQLTIFTQNLKRSDINEGKMKEVVHYLKLYLLLSPENQSKYKSKLAAKIKEAKQQQLAQQNVEGGFSISKWDAYSAQTFMGHDVSHNKNKPNDAPTSAAATLEKLTKELQEIHKRLKKYN